MYSKTLLLSFMVFTNFAFASGNGIERIKFVGNDIDLLIAPELEKALVQKCTPAAVLAYEIVATATNIETVSIDQGQDDVTYHLDIQMRIDPKALDIGTPVDQGTPDHIENVQVVITKYAFNNPAFQNVEVKSLSGSACF